MSMGWDTVSISHVKLENAQKPRLRDTHILEVLRLPHVLNLGTGSAIALYCLGRVVLFPCDVFWGGSLYGPIDALRPKSRRFDCHGC